MNINSYKSTVKFATFPPALISDLPPAATFSSAWPDMLVLNSKFQAAEDGKDQVKLKVSYIEEMEKINKEYLVVKRSNLVVSPRRCVLLVPLSQPAQRVI